MKRVKKMKDNLRDLSLSTDYQNFGNASPLLVIGVFIMISPFVLKAVGIDWGMFNWLIHIVGFIMLILGGVQSLSRGQEEGIY